MSFDYYRILIAVSPKDTVSFFMQIGPKIALFSSGITQYDQSCLYYWGWKGKKLYIYVHIPTPATELSTIQFPGNVFAMQFLMNDMVWFRQMKDRSPNTEYVSG